MIWIVQENIPYEGSIDYGVIEFNGSAADLAAAFIAVGGKIKEKFPEAFKDISGAAWLTTDYRVGYDSLNGVYDFNKRQGYDVVSLYLEEGITFPDVGYFDIERDEVL